MIEMVVEFSIALAPPPHLDLYYEVCGSLFESFDWTRDS
jgi:hypothetical protein